MKNLYFILLTLCIIWIACSNNKLEKLSSQGREKVNYEIVEESIKEEVAEETAEEAEQKTLLEQDTPKKAKKLQSMKSETKKETTKKTPQEKPSKLVEEVPTVQKSAAFGTDYLMGKFDPNTHPDFSTISSKYASKNGMRMRTDAYNQFIRMYNAAKKDGISLKIISATRPFHHQKSIWEGKWNGKRKVDGKLLKKNMEPKQKAMKILRWSSMPGTSRHHWGTDIDINSLNNSYFESGTGKKVYNWLVENASTYGFCQVYSVKDETRPNGYQEEKWHWSYLPVARELTQLYKQKLSNGDISGFSGSESAELIDVKTKYVLGINPKCD